MKIRHHLFVICGVLQALFLQHPACGQPNAVTSTATVTGFKNPPLPHRPATLKILGIGNSFTDDGMQYLPDLLESAGIENVTLGKLSLGGCSLETPPLFGAVETLHATSVHTYLLRRRSRHEGQRPV
ncbi:MAG: hypothetical protein LBT76_05360 [Tannerella sp.]|jgi:hypothetical protein|nr:hypothetical protein [Tannerella sp.]